MPMSYLVVTASYPMLAIAVLIGAFGAPLPLSVALAAAGALARQGHLHLSLLFVTCVAAAAAGDCLGYVVGRLGCRGWRGPVYSGPGSVRLLATWEQCTRLAKHMDMLVFLTRWAITAPGPLVNLLAGARRHPWRRFLAADLAGEALWSASALIPGYLLGGIGKLGTPLAVGVALALTVLGAVLARRTQLGGNVDGRNAWHVTLPIRRTRAA
jgi:membrane-associated protein